MLLNFKVAGFKLFDEQIELDMKVSKGKNCFDLHGTHVLKSSILYGANNSGKTSFVNAVQTFKELFERGNLEKFPFSVFKNFFKKENGIEFEVEFKENEHVYVYGIDVVTHDSLNEYLFINDKCAFYREEGEPRESLDRRFFNESLLEETYKYLDSNELFIAKALDFSKKLDITHAKNIQTFFNRIRFFDNQNPIYFMNLVVEYMKDPDKHELFNSFLSKADVSLTKREITDDYGVEGMTDEDMLKLIRKIRKDTDEKSLETLLKVLKLKSTYRKGNQEISVPSNLFDSIGTNKFANLLLLVMFTIEKGDILFIDELDNSLHYRLARELIKIMNSQANDGAQFIMSAHDIKLLTPLLFRKEQMNFFHRTEDYVEMVSLGDFKEVRNKHKFENLYAKNQIGTLPHPDFDEVLEQWRKKRGSHQKERVEN